uniref:Melanin-concentrating hormone receptor 1 n=1 Tax=Petromyzon marinus TaxID=7757 RepID=S4RLL8_PETMA
YKDFVMPVVFAVICLFGLTGNGLVVFTLLRSPRRGGGSAVPDIFMLNLALADLLFLLCMPFLSHQLLGHSAWRFGAPLCRLIVSLDATTQFGSTYLLTALTLDRYLATVRPLGALSLRLRRPRTAAAAIVALWLLALLSATPYWLYARLLPGDDEACSIVLPDQDRDIYWFTLYQPVDAFVKNIATMSLQYRQWYSKRWGAEYQTAYTHNRRLGRDLKKTEVGCLIFFILTTPMCAL